MLVIAGAPVSGTMPETVNSSGVGGIRTLGELGCHPFPRTQLAPSIGTPRHRAGRFRFSNPIRRPLPLVSFRSLAVRVLCAQTEFHYPHLPTRRMQPIRCLDL